MRRLPFFLLALVLVPSALAGSDASGDGSLVVTGAGARIIVVQGSGLIFGHINQGTLTVLDYRAADPSSAQVSGSMLKLPAGSTTQYSGSDIRFLFPNGRYLLRFDGVGIDISAVGKGAVSGIGIGSTADGTMATNGGKPLPLGPDPTILVFGAGKAPDAVSKKALKGLAH